MQNWYAIEIYFKENQQDLVVKYHTNSATCLPMTFNIYTYGNTQHFRTSSSEIIANLLLTIKQLIFTCFRIKIIVSAEYVNKNAVNDFFSVDFLGFRFCTQRVRFIIKLSYRI